MGELLVTSVEHLAFRMALDKLYPPLNPYTNDPVAWVRNRLHEQVWTAQQAILESVATNRHTIVHSCNSAGKSYIASRAGCWWIDTRPIGQAWLVTTAASGEQVRSVMWQEIRTAHDKGKLVGRVNQTEWWHGDVMLGYGRKTPDQDATGFFGPHRTEGVFVVVDEASGISDVMWEAIARATAGDNDRVLAIGNPDYEGSPFHRRCMNDGWNAIHIDGFETPRFTGEHVPDGSSLLSQAAIDDVINDYGEDSPLYLSMVRGLFPADRNDGVMSWELLRRCMGPAHTDRVGPLRVPVELGVDVAQGGDDKTVIFPRFGPTVGEPHRMSSADSEIVADAVIDMIQRTQATCVKVDWGGGGWGVVGSLRRRVEREVRWPVEIYDFKFGASAYEPTKFVNMRSELWWQGRERCRAGEWDLSGCDQRTLDDLASAQWFETTKNNRIQIEEKREIRRRLGRSPDDADALLLAFYRPMDGQGVQSAQWRDSRLRGRR